MKVRFYSLIQSISFLILFSSFVSTTSTQAQENEQEQIIAFKKVNVLTMESNEIFKNQTVIIKGNKIKKIGASKSINIPKNAKVIKSKKKYLMPGIAEMHAHIPVAQNGDDSDVKDILFLYLSNGITTIRGMLGNPYHLELRASVERGEILSPRIYTSAPSLNGNSVKTKSEAREKVLKYASDGYDFLKMHPGLTLENFNEIAKTSEEVKIKMAGHISTAVGVRRSMEAGYASIDHLDGFVEGLVPESTGVNPDSNGFFGVNFTKHVDLSLLPDLIKKTKEAKVWVVPTHSLMVHILGSEDPNILANRPEMKYMSPKTRFQWKSVKSQVINEPGYNTSEIHQFLEIRDKLLLAMQMEGIGILLGSDAPQIFNVPGFSIQHEMQAMVNAGLTPFQVLESGTVNPARFFDEAGNYGVVKAGASADLILLSKNPLEDITHMKGIEGVMVRGKWLSKANIEEKLKRIAEKHKN